MKNILIFLFIAGGAVVLWKRHQIPEVIENPVYAEIRLNLEGNGRQLEGVIFGKTTNEADCKNNLEVFESLAPKACPICKIAKSECKTELAPRYTKFFDNTPSSVTYLSLARGEPAERELRMIFWGVTLEESNKLCDAVPGLQKGWKGAVKCVRAVSG